MEAKIKEGLAKLDGDLAGTYKSLTEMSYAERDALIEEHILYNDADDKYLRSAGGYNDWPVIAFLFLFLFYFMKIIIQNIFLFLKLG